ncbi:phosphatidylethanolamine N-methyltransferase [Podochytrium sp. JEL0797]|nr:phosphatidylethanolamine N-methyltransferase [Podochytrium sp. JEL0797]
MKERRGGGVVEEGGGGGKEEDGSEERVGSGSDGDDENDEVDVDAFGLGEGGAVAAAAAAVTGVTMKRSFSNPGGRVSAFTKAGGTASAPGRGRGGSMSTQNLSKSYESGSFMTKNMSIGSLKKTKSPIATVVQEAVNQAKPRVDQIVTGARNIVKSNVEKFAGSHWSQTQQLPRHLYSLTFPNANIYPSFSGASGVPRFQLGTPITIQFSCVRETLKRRDWIGIYLAGENLSTEVTTSKSHSRWMFLTNTVKSENDESAPMMTKLPANANLDTQSSDESSTTSTVASVTSSPLVAEPRQTRSTAKKRVLSLPMEQHLLFGNTRVLVRPSDEDQGLRVVTGNLCFHRSRIPWQCGTYEARYQYDGGYSVVTISQRFEIVAECFQWMDGCCAEGGLEANEKEIERIEGFLRVHVERCVDVDVGRGGVVLDVKEDILGRVVMDEWIADLS